jgi:hypothetical protein
MGRLTAWQTGVSVRPEFVATPSTERPTEGRGNIFMDLEYPVGVDCQNLPPPWSGQAIHFPFSDTVISL